MMMPLLAANSKPGDPRVAFFMACANLLLRCGNVFARRKDGRDGDRGADRMASRHQRPAILRNLWAEQRRHSMNTRVSHLLCAAFRNKLWQNDKD